MHEYLRTGDVPARRLVQLLLKAGYHEQAMRALVRLEASVFAGEEADIIIVRRGSARCAHLPRPV
jgi:hypothetical protein